MMYRDATTRLVDDGWLAGCPGVGEEGERGNLLCGVSPILFTTSTGTLFCFYFAVHGDMTGTHGWAICLLIFQTGAFCLFLLKSTS
jgi:hypothetical protein